MMVVILTPVDGIIRWLPRGFSCSPVKLRLAMASMGQSETKVSTLCQELGITRQTLYRHISPVGQLRADGIKLFNRG